ncbi:hypothetical protein F7644_12080 [Tenacibaculum finnmarkense genomovar ulcerans]|uniref:hypothetical protein n=1 Tax=Tenacibaculum finnmarkense TaxID=2781243 RepID=UPI00187B4B3F|nr:hypothetical protein [Tenacibaculum finnmarkense]MBE7646717.1 hypothetical protein [Tenacibaculum finnmarkense genomovar ulcerans]
MKKINMDKLTIISLFMILIGSVGGVMLSIRQIFKAEKNKTLIINTLKDEKKTLIAHSKLLENNLTELKDKNQQMEKNLNKRTDVINIQNKKISKLNEVILDKSTFIQKTLFGNGFCFANIDFLESEINNIIMHFRYDNNNDFPIHNFKTTVYNYDKLVKLIYVKNGKRYIEFNKMGTAEVLSFERIQLNPKSSEIINSYIIPYSKTQKYFIQLYQRNGVYLEKLVFKIIDYKVFWGLQVFKDGKLEHESFNIKEENKKELLNELNTISIEPIIMAQ